MAHGIGGVLALLALAARQGTFVDGHDDALGRILVWLDRWREDTGRGPAWPYWVTRDELRTGHLTLSTPRRPSFHASATRIAYCSMVSGSVVGTSRIAIWLPLRAS